MEISTYYELEPEQNHFYSIQADITHRCNIECANCYIPNRSIPDMDVTRLYNMLERLPKKVEVRLLGGEPTVRSDLFDIISNIVRRGHRCTMMSNGLMIARPGYAAELVKAGMRSIYISMNGADDNAVYEKMDGGPWAERKLKAWENCVVAKMNINIGCILQQGTNNHVPKRLIELASELKSTPILRFRNIGPLGRYEKSPLLNWSWDSMVNKICNDVGVDPNWAKQQNVVNGFTENHTILFPLDPSKKFRTTWIKITNWSPTQTGIIDPDSKRRGRVTQDFKLAPHFEHVKLNENGY